MATKLVDLDEEDENEAAETETISVAEKTHIMLRGGLLTIISLLGLILLNTLEVKTGAGILLVIFTCIAFATGLSQFFFSGWSLPGDR